MTPDEDPSSSSSSSKWLLHRKGTSPLVITAPHGGTSRPDSIPDRTSGCFEPDVHTATLAESVREALIRRGQIGSAAAPTRSGDSVSEGGGGRNGTAASTSAAFASPSLVVARIHRIKVDLARAKESSSDSDEGRAIWDEYHHAIQSSLDDAIRTYGFAHLIDIHGQSHRDAVEVGCLLTNSELRACCATKSRGCATCCAGGMRQNADSSIAKVKEQDKGSDAERRLLRRSSLESMSNLDTYTSLKDVLCGPHSIGTLLEEESSSSSSSSSPPLQQQSHLSSDMRCCYSAVPSRNVPHPCHDRCQSVCPECQPLSSCCCCCCGVSIGGSGIHDNKCSDGGSDSSCCSRACQPCTAFDAAAKRSTPPSPSTSTSAPTTNGPRCRKGNAGAPCSSFGPCAYFWGANTLCMYGGGRTKPTTNEPSQIQRYRGKVAAMQLECPWKNARETDAQIDAFADALAGAIAGFMGHHYGPVVAAAQGRGGVNRLI